ncbi:uncharacterized protein METZ01_LOCUS204553 [marine metagenome]|uniref:Uncharacterized protein n=1 Tax=marine metagenome TaxID=408172 RepID=A0A382EMS8_9ZZZZ
MQRSKETDALVFQEMANQGHYRQEGTTRQGIYVCSPEGKLLSSINSLNADKVLETIQIGLEKWNEIPLSDRQYSNNMETKGIHRWEKNYPDQGLVLNSVNADLFTDPPKQSVRSERWNMDHVWFNNVETRRWLTDDPQRGDIYKLPEKLANRLICFHLVDNVRGQTLPFSPQEIKESSWEIEVLERDHSTVRITTSGHSKAVAKGEWLLGKNDWTPDYLLDHGMETEMLGNASYNLEQKKFTEFELVAIGKRYGKTEFNGRKNSPDSSYIGFLFTLAEDRAADRVAPAFVDIYNADWIVKP